jgi:hypothetical protein
MHHGSAHATTLLSLPITQSNRHNHHDSRPPGRLAVIDYIDRGEGRADNWKTDQLAMIQQAEKPTSAQLLLMVASPIQKLVEASSGGACQSAK